jgi:hypothetical protein
MPRLGSTILKGKSWIWPALALSFVCQLAAQSAGALGEFFEGKQVVVKLDMPGTQQGVDIYPQRPQPLDVKSYGNRMKKFGTSLRNGDSVIITKVKVKDDSIEFQLGGGGYGTAFDDTDSSSHFTPADKSNREKELENKIRNESDSGKRRDMQRELDDLKSSRERRDRRDQAAAEEAASYKQQQINGKRQQGGSRFNIRFDKQKTGDFLTPQAVMTVLAQFIAFPPDAFGATDGGRATQALKSDADGTPQPAAAHPETSLKKGMTREQVEALFGPAAESHESTQNGMKMTSCTYRGKDATVQASFVNGVLVQYTIASR